MRILYFAPVYFDDMKQRPQQIAECLSENHEVYYIEPTVSFVRWAIKRGRSFRGVCKRFRKNLHVIRFNGTFTFHKSVEILDVLGINNWSEYLQVRKLADSCDVIWVGYSGWYTLVRHIKGKTVVFDKMDAEDLLASSWILKKTLQRNMKKLTKISRIVFVTCMKFYEELEDQKERYLIPNAVSEDFISCLPEHAVACGTGFSEVKIFGYIGTIGTWFDCALIERLLELNPVYEVYLAGRNYLPEIKNKRVHYMGIKDNRELPEIIKKWDVCLYNFRQSCLLDTINPVKIYEYLAMNKPVLAVDSAETRRLGDYLTIYKDAKLLGEKELMQLKRPFESREQLDLFIRKNSWQERTREIEKIMRSTLDK